MKKLKKQLMACILTAAMTVCTFATVTPANAATLTAEQYITKMGKAMKTAKSYELKQTSKMTGSIMGQNTDATETQKQIYFKKPLKLKTVTTSKASGKTEKTVTYTKKASNGKYYTYQVLNGKSYSKIEVPDFSSQLLGWDSSCYDSAEIVKDNVKVNGINTVQISAQIKGDVLNEAFDKFGMGDLFSSSSIDFSQIKPIKATIWIDKKTYRPVKIKEDSKDFINDYIEVLYASFGLSGYSGSYSVFTTTTTFSKFNKATNFTIPKNFK